MDKYLVQEYKIRVFLLIILMKMLIMNIHIIFMIVMVDGYQNKEFKEIQMNILMKFIIQMKN